MYIPTDCYTYEECQFVCDDLGEPKGQCAHCGYKWYEHRKEVLPADEQEHYEAIVAFQKTLN